MLYERIEKRSRIHAWLQTDIHTCMLWWLLGCRLSLSLVSCVKLGSRGCELTAQVWSWNIAGSFGHVWCPSVCFVNCLSCVSLSL